MIFRNCGSGDFADLLAATLPSLEGQVVLLRAYVDASCIGDVFCVAAVAFGMDRAVKAEREWVALYGDMPDGKPRCGHMTDLHGRHEQFEGVDKAEADKLCRGSIAIINKYASHVAVISCEVSQVKPLLPTQVHKGDEWILDSYRGVYPCCLHWSLAAMGDSVGRQPRGISYWIEAGDEFYGSAASFLAELAKPFGKPLRDHYALANFAYFPAEEVRLFECADLVAWEWATHIRRSSSNKAQRGSLSPLMKGAPCVTDAGKPYVNIPGRYGNHYSGWPVEKNLKAMQRLMDASSVPAVHELLAEVQGQQQPAA
jgi:hypothetical protein